MKCSYSMLYYILMRILSHLTWNTIWTLVPTHPAFDGVPEWSFGVCHHSTFILSLKQWHLVLGALVSVFYYFTTAAITVICYLHLIIYGSNNTNTTILTQLFKQPRPALTSTMATSGMQLINKSGLNKYCTRTCI